MVLNPCTRIQTYGKCKTSYFHHFGGYVASICQHIEALHLEGGAVRSFDRAKKWLYLYPEAI